jgi:hypothetical protein
LEYIVKNPVGSRLISVLTLTIALALVLATPLSAHAAEPEDAWSAVSVQVYDLEPDKEPTLVMSALTRDEVELPADVAIAVPKGATLTWIGQVIDGMDPNSWPAIEGASLDEFDEYDVVSFTLTDSRRAQLEFAVPEGFVTDDNGLRTVNLEWISAGEAVRARVGISTPHQYHMEDVDPEPVVEVRMSDIFYSVETSPVAEGSVLTISGTMVAGEAPELVEMREAQQEAMEAEAATGAAEPEAISEPVEVDIDTGFTIPPTAIILGLLVAAIGVLVFLIYRNMQSQAAEPAEDDEYEDDESEYEADEEDSVDEVAVGEDDAPAEDSADDADWGDVDVGDE